MLPTRGRQQWATIALESYRAQTYQAKELIILDDSEDPSFPDGVIGADITYSRCPERIIPKKRNLINRMSKGDLIAHFDSDDWSAPERLQLLADLQESTGKGLVGFKRMFCIDEMRNQVLHYRAPGLFITGTSFLYTRDFFNQRQFLEGMPRGSDTNYQFAALQMKQLAAIEGEGQIVARYHSGNTTPKDIRPSNYSRRSFEELPLAFLELCTEFTKDA